MSDDMEHKGQEMKGRAKEAAGSMADREDVRREGRDEKDEAKLKRGFQKIKDALNPKK